MRIRSTERWHKFTEALYETICIHTLGGLTLDSNYHFTAGVEAAEFEANENKDVIDMFSQDEWIAKFYLCKQLSVPLYAISYREGSKFIFVHEISVNRDTSIQVNCCKKLELKDFANWWREIKGTEQTKPLYEARSRKSMFDLLIEKEGLAWGGNVDGFILNVDMDTANLNMYAVAIIESRYTEKNPLEKYDPADFYSPHPTRAGDYNTWKPVVLLASELNTPLFLFTFERKSEKERIGISLINSMSKEKLAYQGDPPYQNIIIGIQDIQKEILKNLSGKPPFEC